MRRLNTIQKKDYFEEIIKYDNRVHDYLQQTHAKVLSEHLEHKDLKNEMKHLKYIWKESKKRFNKLMEAKIQELGYNPRYSDLTKEKSYVLEPSYLHR